MTEKVVQELFAHRRPTAVKRYLLPKLAAMNFVLDGVLDGGVTQALKIAVPDELAQFARLRRAATVETKKQQ